MFAALGAFFATLLAAFAFGTFWFWATIAVFAIALIYLVEEESGGMATFTLILSLLFLNFIAKLGIFVYVLHNPLSALGWVGAYLAVGVVWSVVKWGFFLHGQLDKYKEAKATFLASRNAKELTPELSKAFKKYLNDEYTGYNVGSYKRVVINPQVTDYKSTIIFWMSYWPFSATWTLINDPVRKVYQFMYNRLRNMLQAISDRMFKSVNADLALADDDQTKK
jgi:hypothetical protein